MLCCQSIVPPAGRKKRSVYRVLRPILRSVLQTELTATVHNFVRVAEGDTLERARTQPREHVSATSPVGGAEWLRWRRGPTPA